MHPAQRVVVRDMAAARARGHDVQPEQPDARTRMIGVALIVVLMLIFIVAPLVLLRQWQREIENKVDAVVGGARAPLVLVHHGSKRTASVEELSRAAFVGALASVTREQASPVLTRTALRSAVSLTRCLLRYAQ